PADDTLPQLFELGEIGAIHREDVVEVLEVVARHAARAQAGEVVAPPTRGGHGTTVRRVAGVVVRRAGGIDVQRQVSELARGDAAQYAFGGGRTADVAEAYEQDSIRHGLGVAGKGSSTGASVGGSTVAASTTAADSPAGSGPGASLSTGTSAGCAISAISSRVTCWRWRCRSWRPNHRGSTCEAVMSTMPTMAMVHASRPVDFCSGVAHPLAGRACQYLSGISRVRADVGGCAPGGVCAEGGDADEFPPGGSPFSGSREGGIGASHPTSRNMPPAAITARILASWPSEPKSTSTNLIAAPTRKVAPAVHCAREPTRRALMVSAAPIEAHNKVTNARQPMSKMSSTSSSPGGPSQRSRFACSSSAAPMT